MCIHVIQYLMPCDITKNAWYFTYSSKHFAILQFPGTAPFFFFALRSFKKKLVRNTTIGKFKSEIVKAAEKPLIRCIIDALFNIY